MTAPIEIEPMVVRDPRGRPAKELSGHGGGLGGRSVTRLPPINVTLVGAGDPLFPLPAFGSEKTDVGLPYFAIDCTRHPSARLVVDVGDSGSAGSKLELEYYDTVAEEWRSAGNAELVEAAIDAVPTLRPEIGGTEALRQRCTGDQRFRVVAKGGDDETIATIRGLMVQFIDAGKRRSACNSSISAGADAYEDFCAYADLDALAAAYGFERTGDDPEADWYTQTGDGYRSFDDGFTLVLEGLGRPMLGELALADTTANGGHKALVVDIAAGDTPRVSTLTRWPSEWQFEGPTADVVPRAEATARFNLDAFDDVVHQGSELELVHLRMFAEGGATAAMRLFIGYPTSGGATEPRLFAQRQTTPSGGSGPLNDLGPVSDVLGAGDLQAQIVATVNEGGDVDFDVYLYGWGSGGGGLHSPIYSESVAGLFDRFQTARILSAAAVTPTGEVPGAFKLTTYEMDVVTGSIIVP